LRSELFELLQGANRKIKIKWGRGCGADYIEMRMINSRRISREEHTAVCEEAEMMGGVAGRGDDVEFEIPDLNSPLLSNLHNSIGRNGLHGAADLRKLPQALSALRDEL